MPQFASIPRISGLLNNCLMNCALPYLLAKIQTLSELERSGVRLEEPDGLIYIHYKKLKDTFAQTYGIREVEFFTWQQLHVLTSSHSFLANEIIFAPVFRHFIASVALENLENGYASDDLWRIRDIQTHTSDSPEAIFWPGGQNPSAGKYNCLDASEGIRLFHNQFGFEVRLHEMDTPDPKLGLNSDSFILPLYFNDGHYELQPHANIAGVVADVHTAEMDALPEPLSRIHDLFSSADSAHQTVEGMARLFLYVNRCMRQNLLGDGNVGLLVSLQDYYFTGQFFHDDTPAGRQLFSLALLSIGIQKGCIKAARIRNYMVDISHYSETQADALASKIIQCQGDLNDPAFILTLRTMSSRIEQKKSVMRELSAARHVRPEAEPAMALPNQGLTADFTLKCILGLAAVGLSLLCVAIILAFAVSTTASVIVGGLGVTALIFAGIGLFNSKRNAHDIAAPPFQNRPSLISG